jgi:glutathione S-transferase
MMPRPLLLETLGVSYRKIPILTIGREVYCDTSLIIEALEYYFPSPAYGTVYPQSSPWDYRPLARGFASFWTDKPLFRTTTGLIPHTVWESQFGADRAQLIGHKLNAEKLKAKVPQNLAALDLHLSMLEPGFSNKFAKWMFPTEIPSLADVSLYYQIRWGVDIASGKGIYNLTGGGTSNTDTNVTVIVWNERRYPGLWRWLSRFEAYVASLPDLEVVVPKDDTTWKKELSEASLWDDDRMLVPTMTDIHGITDRQRGVVPGAMASVTPDDTGRGDPTVGILVKIGVEEVVIKPVTKGEIDVRVHFPRLGFVVKAEDSQRAKL